MNILLKYDTWLSGCLSAVSGTSSNNSHGRFSNTLGLILQPNIYMFFRVPCPFPVRLQIRVEAFEFPQFVSRSAS